MLSKKTTSILEKGERGDRSTYSDSDENYPNVNHKTINITKRGTISKYIIIFIIISS